MSLLSILRGTDSSGTARALRTDGSGRLKISHGQPTVISASMTALNSIAAIPVDGYSDAVFSFSGTTVQTVTFEYSPDSTDGTNGTWYPILANNIGVAVAAATTAALTSIHSYRVSAPGGWVHAKTTAYTSGTSVAQMFTTTATLPTQMTTTLSSTSVGVTSTTLATPAATVAGLSTAKIQSAAGTNATLVKATQTRLFGWQLANTTTTWKYLHVHNLTVVPTLGTSSPFFTIPIPPTDKDPLISTLGITLSTGFSYSITGGAADLDTTVVAANDVIGAIYYV